MIKGLRKDFFLLLALFSGLLLSLFFSVFLLTSYFIEEEVANQQILLEAKSLKLKYAANLKLTTSSANFKLYLGKGSLPHDLLEAINSASFGDSILIVNGRHYYFYHFFIAIDQEAYIVVDKEKVKFFEKLSNEVLYVFLLITPLTFALAYWIWWLLAKKIVKPLLSLSNSIQVGSMGNLHIPDKILHFDNEIGILARQLNDSYQALIWAIEREKEFTRDVSHELRTPIAVIMNEIILSENSGIKNQSQALIKKQVHIINNRVDILFALARAESIDKENVSLLTLIEDAILSIHQLIELTDFKIELNVKPQITLFTNENILSLMVSNLIENAIKYSSDGKMVINGTNQRIEFINKTNTLVDDKILNKRVTQDEGLGQGLFLIKRIVESLNGKITIESNKTEFKLIIQFND